MKRIVGLGVVVGFVIMASGASYAKEGHEYFGSQKCKMCHKIEYDSWKKTKLAAAYDSLKALSEEKIKELGLKVGIKDAKLKDCVSCHVTGYNEKDGTYKEEGVTCEVCHGPGADYSKMSVMKDLKAAEEAGVIIPTEKECKACHNEKSPLFKEIPFVFNERRQKVHEFKIPPKWAENKAGVKEEGVKKEEKKEEKKSE